MAQSYISSGTYSSYDMTHLSPSDRFYAFNLSRVAEETSFGSVSTADLPPSPLHYCSMNHSLAMSNSDYLPMSSVYDSHLKLSGVPPFELLPSSYSVEPSSSDYSISRSPLPSLPCVFPHNPTEKEVASKRGAKKAVSKQFRDDSLNREDSISEVVYNDDLPKVLFYNSRNSLSKNEALLKSDYDPSDFDFSDCFRLSKGPPRKRLTSFRPSRYAYLFSGMPLPKVKFSEVGNKKTGQIMVIMKNTANRIQSRKNASMTDARKLKLTDSLKTQKEAYYRFIWAYTKTQYPIPTFDEWLSFVCLKVSSEMDTLLEWQFETRKWQNCMFPYNTVDDSFDKTLSSVIQEEVRLGNIDDESGNNCKKAGRFWYPDEITTASGCLLPRRNYILIQYERHNRTEWRHRCLAFDPMTDKPVLVPSETVQKDMPRKWTDSLQSSVC